MTVNEKNLHDTLTEVLGEETSTPQQAPVKETSEASNDRTEETNAGEPSEPEYVSGIDISDIPVQDRPRIKELLSKKANLLEKGYQPKFQKVAALDKALTDLTSRGLNLDEAQTVLNDYIQKKQNPQGLTQQDKKEMKVLDKLLDGSPVEQKEALRQLRQITQEEASDSPKVVALEKKFAEMEQKLKYFEGKDAQLGMTQAEGELNTLSEKFGKPIIEKYRDIVLSEKQKYPQAKVKDILKYVVPDDEYEQAILDSRKPGKVATKEKLNAISSTGSGISSTKEQINTNQSWKNMIAELVRK